MRRPYTYRKDTRTRNETALRKWREYRLRKVRECGMAVEDYLAMNRRQAGRCAICDDFVGIEGLQIDHDHQTNKIRELLCRDCNGGLGMFRDDAAVMAKAVAYLKRNQ